MPHVGGRPPKYTTATAQKVAEKRALGLTHRQIAADLDMSATSVLNFMREADDVRFDRDAAQCGLGRDDMRALFKIAEVLADAYPGALCMKMQAAFYDALGGVPKAKRVYYEVDDDAIVAFAESVVKPKAPAKKTTAKRKASAQ